MVYQIPTPETVQDLAKIARCAFSLETRDDGSNYWTHGREAPEWIQDLARAAHGTDAHGAPSMIGEDYRFAFIVEALDALEESEDTDDTSACYEFETYHYRLADWLGSHGHRFEYCDEWAEEMGQPEDTYHRLAGGHLRERLEVLDLVRGSLETHLETLDNGPEEKFSYA